MYVHNFDKVQYCDYRQWYLLVIKFSNYGWFTPFVSTQYSYYEQHTATLQYIIFLYTAILSHVHNPLTVHIINISNPLRSEGVLLVEAVTSFIGGS